MGFDLSVPDKPLSHFYPETTHLPTSAKDNGFDSINWQTQNKKVFRKFPKTNFYWVTKSVEEQLLVDQFSMCKNVTFLTYGGFRSMEVMVYGNGESRKQFDKLRFMGNYTTWGCNAIYRDLNVDNLVSVDYAMQQEIYESGYVRDNVCYFTDWSVIPNADDMLLKTMKMDFEPHMIHETLQIDRTDCVIQGKDPKTAEKILKKHLTRIQI